jgi:hypothetical protein
VQEPVFLLSTIKISAFLPSFFRKKDFILVRTPPILPSPAGKKTKKYKIRDCFHQLTSNTVNYSVAPATIITIAKSTS